MLLKWTLCLDPLFRKPAQLLGQGLTMTLSLGFVLRAILNNHNNMLDVIPSRLFIFVILFGSLCSPAFIQEMNYNNADSIVPSRALVNEGLLGD